MSSNRSGSSARTVSTTSKANAMCMRLVAEHPVGAGCQALQDAAGAQEVDVREGAVEEQAFDAGGEADQVEQEHRACRHLVVQCTRSE